MTNFWQDLPRPFFILAPMEAVTDVVFRHVIAAAGRPDVFFTEFTNTNSYCSPAGAHSTRGRLEFTPDEQPIVAHIWGDRPEYFSQMARGMADMGYRGIDINMGCPAPNIAPKGCGSGLIRRPDVAAAIIEGAKQGGLPVSVKTRLGYTHTDEWHDWLTHLLRQDIANLSIHLRTKKEMSKVGAHFELIPEIKRLRDEIAPQTLLTINGDIRDREHGLELVAKYGVDGVMIGRGVFTNPFAFEAASPWPPLPSSPIPLESARRSLSAGPAARATPTSPSMDGSMGVAPSRVTRAGVEVGEPLADKSPETSADTRETADDVSRRSEDCLSPTVASVGASSEIVTPLQRSEPSSLADKGELMSASRETEAAASRRGEAVSGDFVGERANGSGAQQHTNKHTREELLGLLRLHLDLFDKYSAQLEPRRFEPLKRFFKIYVRDFDGSKELREKLMHTKSTDEVREILTKI